MNDKFDDEMGDLDEWTRSLGDSNEAQRDEAQREANMESMERQRIAARMPTEWENLIKGFQMCCEAYNKSNNPERPLYSSLIAPYLFVVKPDSLTPIVTAQFDARKNVITVITPSGKNYYEGDANDSLSHFVKRSFADAVQTGRLTFG